MRRKVKEKIINMLETMFEAHTDIKMMFEHGKYDNAYILLEDCQNAAINIGTCIEEAEGEGFVSVGYLEKYCEVLYDIAENNDNMNPAAIKEMLDAKLNEARVSIQEQVRAKWEIVFCPYKVSMWDSLESIWMAASMDDEAEAYVVPIPYYDRKQDRTIGEFHYEGDKFPSYVPVTHYEKYNFSSRMPDAIFIHNPYDGGNTVTTVDGRFYSDELKKYTDCLAYVPYFIFPKEPATHLIDTCALRNVDYVAVQNNKTKEAYEEIIKSPNFHGTHPDIYATGSPKIDKMVNICKNGISIPDQWKTLSSGKKKVFMNTNVSLILNNNDRFVENISRIFKIFENLGDIFVIWREHPLTYATLKSMRPGIIEQYENLKKDFIEKGLGVFDTHKEAYEAMYFSDCYFGSGGSLVPIYAVTGKPMLVTAYKYPDNIISKKTELSVMLKQADKSIYFSERYENFIELFLKNIDVLMTYKQQRYAQLSEIVVNIEGTAGEKIFRQVKGKLKNEYSR